MIEFIFSIVLFLIAALAMGVGLVLGREGIRGSCGGLNRIPGLQGSCGACGREKCRRRAQNGGEDG